MLKNQTNYFQQKLLLWHKLENKRELPWKGEKDVYRIWLSEIILQQTRAAQGWNYYERFLQTYPTIEKLAKAPLEDVYKLWEGLGYYTRCRNLHATAQKIVFELKGEFPKTYDEILKLKGIGPYTAAAIASFAYNLPHAVVDGNVFRVLSRFFGETTATDSSAGKKLFEQLANDCIDKSNAAVYNQAIMDFGATICKPDNPLCNSCALNKKCVALKKEMVMHLPVKEKQLKQRSRWFVFFVLEYKGRFAVQQRTEKDVWQNLYQFPAMEFHIEKEWKTFLKLKNILQAQTLFTSAAAKQTAITKPVVQKLSHQTIHAVAVLVKVPALKKQMKQVQWKTKAELKQLPFPKIMHQLMQGKVMELF
ncbi:MAG: A/G-specific adenine glycosylase [Chitinophagaceae bacterium]|nr:A/G-specific adenine glycosylase [Chitinophagaceae bacterium]